MSLTVLTNPTKRDITLFLKKHPQIDRTIAQKIQGTNIRIEFEKHEKYVFLIFYIPEYRKAMKVIESTEVNLFYDRSRKHATIFAFESAHFFAKYKKHIEGIPTEIFSKFIENFLHIVLEDEARIIEHILEDTRVVKKEYTTGTHANALIRHLTNNLVNITTMKLIVDNQDKLLDRTEEFIRNYEDSPIKYQRTYISEELTYAKEFCETLMQSLNTTYQVRMSETLYAYTKYTFILFLSGAIVDMVYLFLNDSSPIRLTFWFVTLAVVLGTLWMFRKFR